MITLAYSGPLDAAALQLLNPLLAEGQPVLLNGAGPAQPLGETVALVALEARAAWPPPSAPPWLGWNRDNDPRLALDAYQAGAAAVLPAGLTAEVLRAALEHAPARPAPGKTQAYGRHEFIALPADYVLEVVQGVVASTVLHADGAEVLLGLYGPGQQIVGHPHDGCCLQLMAHTPAAVRVTPWQIARAQPETAERLRFHLAQMEAWAAMQARPHLDQRILGLLSLLAEQFGAPHPCGTLLTVRLTHAQLATAVGATRGTVTRTLSDLRTRGLLNQVDTPDGERLCLREPAAGQHLHTSA